MIRRWLVAIVALLAILPGSAAAEWVELEARAWVPDLGAEARIEGGSRPGTTFDFERDLGTDDHPLADLRLAIFTSTNGRVRFGYTRVDFDGDTVLRRAIDFNGSTFAAGARVTSELDVHYARLGWLWLPPVIPGVLKIGPVLEVKAFVAEALLDSRGRAAGLRETEHVTIVVPTLGVATEVSPHRLIDLFAEVSGLPAGDHGHVVDAEAGVRLNLLPFLTVTGGYRFFEIRGEEDRSFARLRLNGPFLGGRLRF